MFCEYKVVVVELSSMGKITRMGENRVSTKRYENRIEKGIRVNKSPRKEAPYKDVREEFQSVTRVTQHREIGQAKWISKMERYFQIVRKAVNWLC